MNRPHPLPSRFSRPAARRRGFMLVEILIAAFLTAVVAGVATQILMRVLDTDRVLANAERSDTALDRAVRRLRHDVERAAVVTSNGDTLTLGPVTWTAEPNALVRREGGSIDRLDALRVTPSLSTADGVVTLDVAGRTWAFRPLVDAGGVQ